MSDVDKLMTEILGERPVVKDKALRELIDARMKTGGAVMMAKGGLIKSLVKAIGKELPEAKASQKTQIPGTEPTYRKAYDILEREKPGGRTLDYGAGLGHGSRLMGAESFEPFPREGFSPTFIRPEDIPTEEFDRLVNLNVLNVMPRDVRDATVENIGRVMRPGGMGIVTTRGRDVLNAAGEAGPEPMSKITSIGTYQKGFSPEELREYLTYMLGKDYDISRLNLGPAGAMVRKKGKAEGGEIKMAKGGIGKNVGRGMAGLTRSRQPLDPKEIQAMMLDVSAGVGVPFAEAGAEYLRGNVEDAEFAAAIDAGLMAIPGAAMAAKPVYRAAKKAAPAVREAAYEALESAMESGVIPDPRMHIFIGPKSKLWDKTAAKDFAKLEKAGASPQEAWHQTGTFRSPDGILRQEISDQPSRLRRERMMDLEQERGAIKDQSNAEQRRLLDAIDRGEISREAAEAEWKRIRQPLLDRSTQIGIEEYPAAKKLATPGKLIRGQDPKLVQTLYHPELFKAYPQLKHIRTEYRVDPSARPSGHLTVGGPSPWSSSNAPSMLSVAPTTLEARNIILHEAQHGIQRLENMGLGGTPAKEWDMLPSEMHPTDYVQRLEQSREGLLRQLDDLAKQVPEGGFELKSGEMHPLWIRGEVLSKRINNTEDAIRAAKQGEYHPLYHRMAGEAEARAVQKRMNYGPEDRQEIFPLDQYDVPIDQLVVRTEPYATGGAVMMAKGGAVKSLIKKASEALGGHEGKSLMVTQSDRTKVGGKFLGGPGFSSLQLTDPFYKEAEAVWGVGKKGAATKMINAAQKMPEGKAIWSTMIGSPEQHKSNQQVFDELLRSFRSSAKEGNLDPDLQARINAKLAEAVDKEGKSLFPENVDILSPKFRRLADTFDRRAVAADAMAGVQLGGKKGQIIDYSGIIERTTDPLLIEQPTHAIGPRLFRLEGDVIERPDLHPAYPFILTGEDLATEFNPVPRDIMLRDFVEGIRQSKGREPGFMDLTRNTPSQFLSEEFLTGLQKSGYKRGGPVKKGALPTKRK